MLKIHHFALWFSDVDVTFMIRDASKDDWTNLHTLPLSAHNFVNEMHRFCDQVRKDRGGDTLVTVFLPVPDIQCDTVSVIGRKHVARDQHVRRTLARQVSDQADNIVAHFGKSDTGKMAPVCFAKCETLQAAEHFVNDFGFQVLCFSTMFENGLDCEPCLMLPHQIERVHRMNAVPKVSYAFRGAAAAMVAASVIIATDIPNPNAVMMASILDAGNVPGQPVHVTVQLAGFENAPSTDSPGTLAAVTALEPARALSEPLSISAELSGAVKAQLSPIVVAALGADRIVPSLQSANQMDAITAHKGGFHVYVGLQGNLTQMTTADSPNAGAGKVVFIQKPVSEYRAITRVVDQWQVVAAIPAQFNLTELEIASFSRP